MGTRQRTPTERNTPRVILQQPLEGTLGNQRCLIIEVGLGGAKLEHANRVAIGDKLDLEMPQRTLRVSVRYSVALPGESGIVYHTGAAFEGLSETDQSAIFALLIREAEAQVASWEANLEGRPLLDRPGARSAVAPRFVWMRMTARGWERTDTTDPNQPIDGFAVPAEHSAEEIKSLCDAYQSADEPTRASLRQVATLAIIERMRQK
ncbi:MAG: hypothetical protein ACYC7A_13165 [Thermoanaerobaculia bacterium]